MNLSTKNLSIFGGVVIGLILAVLALWLFPQRQSDLYRAKFTAEDIQKLEQKDRIQLEKSASDIENSARLTLAQIIGGLALLSGLYFTYQNVKTAQENLRVTEEGKLTERFSNAVELLGSDKLEIRLGGIYALERIARDSQKDHWTVMEILTAFVRENSPYLTNEEDLAEETEFKLREDIQAIMTVIGRRKWTETEKSWSEQRKILNLQRVNLTGCTLNQANLADADLWNTNLSYADLVEANLERAYLNSANLSFANLSCANLNFVKLNRAKLIQTSLWDANMKNAKLYKADLSKADLRFTDLKNAELSGADLNGANLSMTNLVLKTFITLEQGLSARNFEKAKLTPLLEKELKEWRAKQTKGKAGAGGDSSENQAGE